MAKSKSARLSLTMPGPVRVSSDLIRSPTGKETFKTDSRRSSRQIADVVVDTNTDEEPPGPKVTTGRAISPPENLRSGTPKVSMLNHSTLPASPTSPISLGPAFVPHFSTSPQKSSQHTREQSKSFFANLKASKSSAKIQSAPIPPPTIRKISQDTTNTVDDEIYLFKKKKSTPDFKGARAAGSVPDLPVLDPHGSFGTTNTEHSIPYNIPRRPVGSSASSQNSSHFPTTKTVAPTEFSEHKKNGTSVMASTKDPTDQRKNKTLLSGLMKKTTRYDGLGHTSNPNTPTLSKPAEYQNTRQSSRDRSRSRNRSPHFANEYEEKNSSRNQLSQSFRDGSGATFLHGVKSTTARAAESLGKASNRLFQKTSNKPTPNYIKAADPSELYILKVINQPLVEQTRRTRIAGRLEMSKDKTEFWMPSLPWRCIDYLNYNGCELEGLYRVPGSAREVKLWQKRFDTERDVNLFDQPDLHDVNVIGSLFKAWLRDLPDEIFPKEIQDSISAQCGHEERVPDQLKEALSNLPPWNYYLLFAITCHLSLLYAHADKNKMGYNNLVICFLPSLHMNGDCFRWLVCDWRNCWTGCNTEKAALELEYAILDNQMPPYHDHDHDNDSEQEQGQGQEQEQDQEDAEDADPFLSSSEGGCMKSTTKPTTKPTPLALTQHYDHDYAHENGNLTPNGSSNTHGAPHRRNASQLPELSLLQPISPIFASDP